MSAQILLYVVKRPFRISLKQVRQFKEKEIFRGLVTFLNLINQIKSLNLIFNFHLKMILVID